MGRTVVRLEIRGRVQGVGYRCAMVEQAGLPYIDTQRCTGCGRCVAVCDPHLLSLEVVRWKKFAVLHGPERCTGCSACAASCPFHAIAMRKRVAVG